MSALPLKADVCGANPYICFGPIADMKQPSFGAAWAVGN
jgi:hypothetical protein